MHDVIVIGGSYAGISAALQLARARRRVMVIDADTRRNRFATAAHGFLGQDGRSPAVIAATGKAELTLYPTVTWLDGHASHARIIDGGFAVELAAGEEHRARRLVLAVGVADALPDVPGLSERWGRTVFHCPYCHGYELNRGAIGVLATGAWSVHQAELVSEWGDTTYFTRGLFEPSDEERAALERRGIIIDRRAVTAVEGGDHEITLRFDDDGKRTLRGLFVASRTQISGTLADELGCAVEEGPLGPFVRTDAMQATSVPGVFACGDMSLAAGSLAFAVADGARAGISVHRSLVFPTAA